MPGQTPPPEVRDFHLADALGVLQHLLQLDGELRAAFFPQGHLDLRVLTADPDDPPADRFRLFSRAGSAANPGPQLWVGDENGLKRELTTSTRELIIAGTDYSGNLGDYRIRNIGGTGAHRFSFHTPSDFSSLVSIGLIYVPSAGAAGADKDIDLSSEYGSLTGSITEFVEANTSILFDFTGQADEWHELDISSVFTQLAARHTCGLFLDHKSIGGNVRYIALRMVYNTNA